ncbi:MAG: hypothetical protein CR984_05830 [Proteobacteria bacterium]|nr:MAG: hypothetical protein CR984_05830 [Pseudomonadota bacterium]
MRTNIICFVGVLCLLMATHAFSDDLIGENNLAPLADAGGNWVVREGTTVILDGSYSSDPNGDNLTYRWEQIDKTGYKVELTDATSMQPSFTAPTVPADGAILVFRLTVEDPEGLTSTSEANVFVNYKNDPPTADAGDNRVVDETEQVRLDGSKSSDPEGDTLRYEWIQIDTSGLKVTLSKADSATPTFTAPDGNGDPKTLVFRLTVTDPGGCTSTDKVSVRIMFKNDPPAANAGKDQTVTEGKQVKLDGRNSSDPDGETLRYRWVQVDHSGFSVELSDARSATPTFTAPDISTEEVKLAFKLQVWDGQWRSSTDRVQVTVRMINEPPIADAGSDQTVDEGAPAVTLDGSASSDPDGHHLYYAWTQVDDSGYAVDLSYPNSATPTFSAPDVGRPGVVLIFRLTVKDTGGLTSTDDVQIPIVFDNHPPTADAGKGWRVDEASVVVLDGRASSDPDGGMLKYAWKLSDGGGYPVELSDADTATPSFRAPAVEAGGASLIFELTVTDNGGLSATTTVCIDVDDTPAVTRSVYATEVIDYGASPMPDSGMFMNWNRTDGFFKNAVGAYPEAGADLNHLLAPMDSTTAAGWCVDASGGYLTLAFETVFQADGTAEADIVVHGFGDAYNTPHTDEKGAVTISVSPDGEMWTVVSDYAGYADGDTWTPNLDFFESPSGVPAPVIEIDLDDDIANAYIGPVAYIRFRLGDGSTGHGSSFFITAVEGGKINIPPIADAGVDRDIHPGATVTLDGRNSEDIDQGVGTYTWTQIDTGYGNTVVLEDDTSPTPVFIAPARTGVELTFELTVTDLAGKTDTDTVTLTTAPAMHTASDYVSWVVSEFGCLSWNDRTADGGAHALGPPDFGKTPEGDCSGWQTGTGDLVLLFDPPLANPNGSEDLVIAHCGTGRTVVLVSAYGQVWNRLSTLPAGDPTCEAVTYTTYDIGEAGIDDVHLVKIEKTGSSPRFIDAVFVPAETSGSTARGIEAD